MTQLKESFSMDPQEIQQSRQIIQSMVKDLSERFPGMNKKSDSGQSYAQEVPSVPIERSKFATAATRAEQNPLKFAWP